MSINYEKSDEYQKMVREQQLKALRYRVQYLNKIIQEGTITDTKKAVNELKKFLEAKTPLREISVVRRFKNANTKYLHIPADSHINEGDICVLYTLK